MHKIMKLIPGLPAGADGMVRLATTPYGPDPRKSKFALGRTVD